MKEEIKQPVDINEQIAQRRAKLKQLRAQANPFPNDFHKDAFAGDLHAAYSNKTEAELTAQNHRVTVAGRIMTRRIMGKASFVHIQDMTGQIQLYLKQDVLPQGEYEQFKSWDLGDIIGVEGVLFKTKMGELTVL